MLHLICLLIFATISASPLQRTQSSSQTWIKTENITSSSIEYTVLKKPHHLFVGRCKPEHRVLHQENIILLNDGKSRVMADIRTDVNGPVNITCVQIYDEIPHGEGGYPSFRAGGVGSNFIEFNVVSEYGKGFHFFVKIFGFLKKETDKNQTLTDNKSTGKTTLNAL